MKKTLLQVSNLKKTFRHQSEIIHAVDNVSFTIEQGTTLGLVGESGCGKSTIAKMLLKLLEPDSGTIVFDQMNYRDFTKKTLKEFRKKIQIIFQDPYNSLNPRMTIKEILLEPLVIHNLYSQHTRLKRVLELLDMVHIPQSALYRYPYEFSGGQRQRIGIARALAVNPAFIVCDEPVSALDVSIQAQILNLLIDLQKNLNLTYLFISHDLAIIRRVCNEIAVMHEGKIVEISSNDELFKHPKNNYTKLLLSSVLTPMIQESTGRTDLGREKVTSSLI